MIRYKSFYFPAKYKKLSKEELFIEFLNKNIFLWKTPALYSKKIFEILKDEVLETDENNITWWKLWFRTTIIIAESYHLYYVQYTAEKILEAIEKYNDEELARIILDFNEAMILRSQFSMFITIEESLRLYRDHTVPEGILRLYKNRNKITKIINDNIPITAIDKSILKVIIGEETLSKIKDLDYSSIIREFLFREAVEEGVLKEEHFKVVIKSFLNNKFNKQNPNIIDKMWDEVNAIYNEVTTPDDENN